MSDDFGGKLQDIEEKEKENSDEESEKEEEPDKEMGDTEQGADTLDQQVCIKYSLNISSFSDYSYNLL